MKKLIALALALVTLLALVSCGGNNVFDLRSTLKEAGFGVSIQDKAYELEDKFEDVIDEGLEAPIAYISAYSEDSESEYIEIIIFDSSSDAKDYEEYYLEAMLERMEERAEDEDEDLEDYLEDNYDVKSWDEYLEKYYDNTCGREGKCVYRATREYIVEIAFG